MPPEAAPVTSRAGPPAAVLRDLMGLMALPALWVGRDASTVLRLMVEAVETVVRLDASFIDVPVPGEEPGFVRLRIAGAPATAGQVEQWAATLEGFSSMGITATPSRRDTPAGPMRVIRLSMGFSASQGSVWFASAEPTFPDVHQAACLRAVATLAATGLEAAAVDRERARASRVKDEFLAMLGHELRNPLAPIFMALELLKRKGDAPLGRPYEIIERQARHLSRLVDDLMDVSRITNSKFDLHKEPVSLRLCLMSALEAVGPAVEARGQHLQVTLPDADLRIHGDATRLTQIFANLLNNAAKYTQQGGHLALRTRVDATRVVVSVQDDGPGIGAELMPRLFGIFEQGASTLDRAGGGLGIGLALVKNFVDLHGGTVTVASDGAGHGSEFVVTLPVMAAVPPGVGAAAVTQSVAVPQRLPAGERTRVLVVDDNVDAAGMLASVLTEEGCEVRTATDPVVALRLAREFRPQVAILDIGLPGMSGHELAGALRRSFDEKALRLIALSGYGQPEDRQRSLASGFEVHFVKPLNYGELVALLHEDRSGH